MTLASITFFDFRSKVRLGQRLCGALSLAMGLALILTIACSGEETPAEPTPNAFFGGHAAPEMTEQEAIDIFVQEACPDGLKVEGSLSGDYAASTTKSWTINWTEPGGRVMPAGAVKASTGILRLNDESVLQGFKIQGDICR